MSFIYSGPKKIGQLGLRAPLHAKTACYAIRQAADNMASVQHFGNLIVAIGRRVKPSVFMKNGRSQRQVGHRSYSVVK